MKKIILFLCVCALAGCNRKEVSKTQVACTPIGASLYNGLSCSVSNSNESRSVSACWDVEIPCINTNGRQSMVTGHQCTQVSPGGTTSRVMTELQGIAQCERAVGISVTNLQGEML